MVRIDLMDGMKQEEERKKEEEEEGIKRSRDQERDRERGQTFLSSRENDFRQQFHPTTVIERVKRSEKRTRSEIDDSDGGTTNRTSTGSIFDPIENSGLPKSLLTQHSQLFMDVFFVFCHRDFDLLFNV